MTSPGHDFNVPTTVVTGNDGSTRLMAQRTQAAVIAQKSAEIKAGGWGAGSAKYFGDQAAQQVELAGLQSRTQKLEGVIGYAHAYANGGTSLSLGSVKYPMSNQIGPVVGVTMTNGSFFLGSKGLWVADGHATFDFLSIGVKKISMTLKVYAPNGSEHFKRTSIFDTGEQNTRSVHMPFTVPSAGYYVELWVNAAVGRGVFGGSEWNGLSVSKISTEEN